MGAKVDGLATEGAAVVDKRLVLLDGHGCGGWCEMGCWWGKLVCFRGLLLPRATREKLGAELAR